ncbi:DUF5666 domain-containing protein [bacterium]|nr:DUF5666 domain-containing protein [bacterium]
MNKKFIFKSLFIFLSLALVLPSSMPALAEGNIATMNDSGVEVTANDIGLSEGEVNNASKEDTIVEEETGMLIEIGNTTAESTTIIIRPNGATDDSQDQTVEIEASTSVLTDSSGQADLSDWIAGDQVTYTVDHYTNSGAKVAKKLKNRSFKWNHRGKNGWVEALRPEKNEMDVTWNNKIFTLDTSEARMVAGEYNPATLDNFEIGDRIRARVVEDGDGNFSTWDAKIIVVLRRGDELFMRVTRWVVSATVTMIPEDVSLPATIEVEINPSKFFEEGDVNNLVGAPGEKLMVDIYEDTNLRRRFLGKAFLKEFSEGDQVRIIGRRAEDTGHLVAKFIKNNSIQILGVAHHLAKVLDLDPDQQTIGVSLVRTNLANKNWTVQTNNNTKFTKNNQEIEFGDIKVNDIIRVRGVANRQTKVVEARKVHVLSLRASAD